jgi:transposase
MFVVMLTHPTNPYAAAAVCARPPGDDRAGHGFIMFTRIAMVCRRLMTTSGVGPVVALTFRATVDVPARFRKSKSVGAVFGLACSRYQSGEIDWSGSISRCGDEMMRVMLYEAAQRLLRSKKWSWLKAWAMQIARRRGMKKAIVALARRWP